MTSFSFLWGLYLGAPWVTQGFVLFQRFEELVDTFPKRLHRFPFLPRPCAGVPVSLHSPTLVIVSFLLVAILVGVRWRLLVLIRIFVMISDVKHRSLCFWAIRVSLEKPPL